MYMPAYLRQFLLPTFLCQNQLIWHSREDITGICHIAFLIDMGSELHFGKWKKKKDRIINTFPLELDAPFAPSHPHLDKWFWGHRRRSWSPCWPPFPLLHTRSDSGSEPWLTNLKSQQPGSFSEDPQGKQMSRGHLFFSIHDTKS